MFGGIQKIAVKTIVAANIVAIIMMLIVGYAGHVDPREHAVISNLGLIMPLMIVINLAFLVFWAIARKIQILIPIIGFVLCWGPLRLYCPVNLPSKPPKGAIKILSYNVFMFAPWDIPEGEPNPIVEYIINSGADIVCLQEASYDLKGREKIDSAIANVYQYCDTVQKKGPQGDVLCLYSKFPILSRERVRYESANNLSEAYVLNIHGEKVLLVNNHFETVGLNNDDKDRFHEFIKGEMPSDSTGHESKFLAGKLGAGARKRAPEADAVARLIARYRQKGMSVIVCGDFNDTQLSYTHRRVAEGLTDCYTATGNGPGWSYHKSAIYVRIDNILCSPDWTPYNAHVDRSVTTSDHYPIVCWLKK